MRNLTLAALHRFPAIPISDGALTKTVIDLDEKVCYAVSERDGEVGIWRINQDKARLYSTLSTPSQVISAHINPSTRLLILVLQLGDIVSLSLDEENPTPQVEGTVDSGILAASWSPDDSILAMITAEEKLILMTAEFDVLSEVGIQTTEFGTDAPINLGWGSKQTQFHGSLGKSAAQTPSHSSSAEAGTSPDDDGHPRISWRGDSAFLVVSSLGSKRHRVLRVYDRNASLQSTSEPIPGLEHTLSWRPSGNLIASTQRFSEGGEGGLGKGKAGRHDVVFFERNGLRHGEFGLRPALFDHPYKIRETLWSPDSTILALWIRKSGEGGDLIQLWTTGNYHWYLKQEIAGIFTEVAWHPEKSSSILLTTRDSIIERTYTYETLASTSQPPNDSGLVCVFDGATLLLTTLRTHPIPPPLSSHTLSLSHPGPEILFPPSSSLIPIHAAFSSGADSDSVVILWEWGYVEVWVLNTRLSAGRGVMKPEKVVYGVVNHPERYRQVGLVHSKGAVATIFMLGSSSGSGGKDLLTSLTIETSTQRTIRMPGTNGRIVCVEPGVVWQSVEGVLFRVSFDEEEEGKTPQQITRFPQFCLTTFVSPSSPTLYFGLTQTGKLFCTSEDEKSARLLANNANSLTVSPNYLIYTDTSHEASFVPFSSLTFSSSSSHSESEKQEKQDGETQAPRETRAIERGSRIVSVVPSTMSLVLQMPRGNLEIIYPRALVMCVVRGDLRVREYRKAFLACRKHRIDLDVIVDEDREGFLDHIGEFCEQVEEVDYLNLFLANIGRGSLPPEIITQICDSVREHLSAKDLTKYVNSILTTHVVKTPPDHEAGLELLLKLRESTPPPILEEAIKYIIFLVDANKLFDTALGMYDFSLVLMIAQYAQKDPREYLPFLRELRTLPVYYQRFRIDDYLKRVERALRDLSLAGPEHFEEALAYAETHQLYKTALSIWKGTERYNDVLVVYGDHLFERREFAQAAIAYTEAQSFKKALRAYEKDLNWQAVFDLAVTRVELGYVGGGDDGDDDNDGGDGDGKLGELAFRVAEELLGKKRYYESARVLLDYSGDVRSAVMTLVQGNLFSEARRVTSLHRCPELVEEIIHPASLESRNQIHEDLNEMKEQLRKQLARIEELRIKKVADPDAFYGNNEEDGGLHNVDVMTDISMPATQFTRYTAAPSSVSRKSKQSSRSKRKMERKVGSGKKGTVDEEEYLLNSVSKLVVRFTAARDETRALLPHLFAFSTEHRSEGVSLQKEVDEFSSELREAVDFIWTKEQGGEEPVVADTWAKRMEEIEKKRLLNPVDKVPKPEVSVQGDWRVTLLEF